MRRAISFVLLIPALGACLSEPGPRVITASAQEDGRAWTVTVRDEAGLVRGVGFPSTLVSGDRLPRRLQVENVPGSPDTIQLQWTGGSCHQPVDIRVTGARDDLRVELRRRAAPGGPGCAEQRGRDRTVALMFFVPVDASAVEGIDAWPD